MRKEAPIYEFHRAWGVDEFLFGEGGTGSSGAEVVELLVAGFAAVVAVVDFSGGVGGVAVLFKVLGEGGEVFEFIDLTEPGAESVDPGGVRAEAHHEAGAGGIAEGGLAVGVEENGALGGELVDVGSFGIGMSAEAADPVVLIIDRDEEDVGLLCRKS